MDHSENVRIWTCRFDYLGIVIPLWGTTISSTHFGFRDAPTLQHIYQVIATLSAIACAIITLQPLFSGPKNRKFRTAVYLLLGLSSFLPVLHGIRTHGFEEHERRMGVVCYLGLGVCHVVGATMYAARVPERWVPRKCDVWGSSHQCMHVGVVVGAIWYGVGILGAFEYWRGEGIGEVE
jgi:adiponectin receptor